MSDDLPPAPIAPVSRPKAAARDWYDFLSAWYDLVADSFEAPARESGLRLLDPGYGERILDVGCGTGTALVPIARAVGAAGTAVGIDLAPGMCRSSRRALANAGVDPGAVVMGDAATLPVPDDAFDALFASFVLELFDTVELPAVLEEWRRVLEPNGRLCVVALSRRPGPVTELYEWIHERFPTTVDCRPIYVRETLLESGFRVVDGRSERVWRLPAEVVLVRQASSRS
ncbi:class I SAM-dependent methyltransferase [Natronobacterium gregoryi]|uniref:2-heptaprenyl-1,4-naphthoquinone methyltransferase n=2 Tax=Natronobacterium gregoryi TaxID=44930 RepID=L0ACY0_NATGS|nr:methyltransferase domain-containing protein [Natronobacterium gregoryi]AFZ71696.1 methylase involved in ubiquinone/menaquinone biosynthesis [Natronobacterium gregoryi SP2]ELY72733.1 2-heptaprenyl-1,4-naphthoquinone methyltransferase [Natronobacterium gregoryi SP2]PLK20257.1 methyltransferase domain-containing protein [Natronobacterium gregoryi SP2]SFJ25807.1 demethylmenaquinone methyltransferase / 2-methoxy-6-polyprenyl-1,4-benzoquinol methylase [Natronobacterium gregoryi]